MVNDHLESLISRNILVSDPFHPPGFSDPHTTKANFGPAAMAPRLEFDEWGNQWGGWCGRWSWPVMAGHGKPAMSGFNMFFSQPRHDHFTARTAALSSHERWPFLEQSQQWKLSDASNTKNKKSYFNKYFILLFYGAKLNLFHAVRSPPADALPSLFGTSFVLARKAWDWLGILRCHVFFGSGIAVLEKGDHRW